MTDPANPHESGSAIPSPARRVGTVMVAISPGAEGEAGLVYADLDAGERTMVANDPETLRLFGELERSVARHGAESSAISPTAATLAALGEASRVRPRAGRWVSEATPPGGRLRLPRPIEELDMPIGDALRRRRSIRASSAVDASLLSSLLYHSARVRTIWRAPDGYPASSRASPSAGARHPIDLVVIPVSVTGLGADRLRVGSPYLFDPMTCELVALSGPERDVFRDCRRHSGELLGTTPAVVVAMMARLDRTFSRYRGSISLVFRDAGALLATIGLVASALGLACCPLASVLPPATAFDLTPGWVEVGGVALGGAE